MDYLLKLQYHYLPVIAILFLDLFLDVLLEVFFDNEKLSAINSKLYPEYRSIVIEYFKRPLQLLKDDPPD